MIIETFAAPKHGKSQATNGQQEVKTPQTVLSAMRSIPSVERHKQWYSRAALVIVVVVVIVS